jgi:hypothetical protein
LYLLSIYLVLGSVCTESMTRFCHSLRLFE